MALFADGAWVLTAVDGGREQLGDLLTASAVLAPLSSAAAPLGAVSAARYARPSDTPDLGTGKPDLVRFAVYAPRAYTQARRTASTLACPSALRWRPGSAAGAGGPSIRL